MFRVLLLGLAVGIVFCGCSSQKVPPVLSLEERHQIELATVDNQARASQQTIDEFEKQLLLELQSDYLWSLHVPEGGHWSLTGYKLRVIPNPFKRFAGKGETISLDLVLERVQYGPYADLDKVFAAYMFFGTMSAIDAAHGENHYAAGVQYRATATHSERTLPSILVRAASTGDVREFTRSQMMTAAQTKAAREFLYLLAERVLEAELVDVEMVEYAGTKRRIEKRARELGLAW
jgi:hypothetical protein